MARRRRNSGASRKYAPAIKEQMNVVRLMADDCSVIRPVSGANYWYTGNSLAGMIINAGLATLTTTTAGADYLKVNKSFRMKVLSVVAAPGVNVELPGTGETFINNSLDKPMKVKVPRNDLVDAQWFTFNEGTSLHVTGTIPGSIGAKNPEYTPFGGAVTSTASADDAKAKTFECITIGYCFL